MSSPLTSLRNPGRPIHAAVILLGGTTEILDIAPLELLTGMTKDWVEHAPEHVIPDALKSQTLDIKFHWVNEKGDHAKLSGGLKVQCTDSFETCPPLDIALLGATDLTYTPNETELSFLRQTHSSAHSLLGVCGGMMPPAQAGLLDGKTATGPRFLLDDFRNYFPKVTWTEKRWHRDGKIWTSGALLNGTDMVRAWALEEFGGEGTLMNHLLQLGGWPVRDVDYKDEDEYYVGKSGGVIATKAANGVNGVGKVGAKAQVKV